jgi:urate oxidase
MPPIIHSDSWGKVGVQLVRLQRDPHDPQIISMDDLVVTTTLRGDTTEVYVLGDNAKILSTDAQKNAIYALAKEPWNELEVLAGLVADYFVTSQEPVSCATVTIEQRPWHRSVIRGDLAPHTFEGGSIDRSTGRAEVTPEGRRFVTGLAGLRLFNATGSEFRGFPRDKYTTGAEVPDRVLATEMDVEWSYSVDAPIEFSEIRNSVRNILIESFASVFSKSIQYSMYAMATAVFAAHNEIDEITLRFPNLHHYPVDLKPFGLSNDREIFITAPAPHSLIEATIRRDV